MEPGAELEEGGNAALDLDRARRGLRRSRDELEERRLARSVRAHNAEALPALDGEAHIPEGMDDLSGRGLTKDELLQSRRASGPEPVALLDMLGADRGHARDAREWRSLASETLVDHRAVAALEVELDDDASCGPANGVDDDRVLRLVGEAEHVARVDADRLLRRDGELLRDGERAVGEAVPGDLDGRGGNALQHQRRRPAVGAAEATCHVRQEEARRGLRARGVSGGGRVADHVHDGGDAATGSAARDE